jgi:CBS domain containing-hemolysin-like protein
VFRVSARLPLDELGDLFGIELDDDEVDSAGGLLTKTLGRLPETGSAVEVSGLKLRAERVEGRRKLLRTIVVEADQTLLNAKAAFDAPKKESVVE